MKCQGLMRECAAHAALMLVWRTPGMAGPAFFYGCKECVAGWVSRAQKTQTEFSVSPLDPTTEDKV